MTKSMINDVADYIIVKLDEGRVGANVLKLQKLLYYVQAWHLAFKDEPLFAGKFQAWVHGPVNRAIYNRFAETHTMYSAVTRADIAKDFDSNRIPAESRAHIDEILEAYAPMSGTQLEAMTHDEEPWIKARGNLKPSARCEVELDENLIKEFFRSELKKTT